MKSLRYLSGFVFAVLFILIYSCFYTVTQGQQAVVLRLGKIVMNNNNLPVIKSPGLQFKWPFIDTVQWFDMRLQTLSVDSSRVLTQEQKYLIVDYYAKWRITNIPLYFTRTGGDPETTRTLLQQKINDSLRAQFGKRLLTDIISDARANIMSQLEQEANNSAQQLGIDVIDVRIKRIDLPAQVSLSVFNNMRAGREMVAAKHRADGRAAAEKIQADADATAVIMIAKAQADAAKIRADGDAAASKIYAEAYSKDAEFYAFYRSLDAYTAIFSQQQKDSNYLVLKPDSEFFKYFNHSESK
jgi:membrane protease subunit HflC